MTILVLMGMVSVIIWEMFYGRISLNIGASVAASDFVSWFRLDLMCIPLIINMRQGYCPAAVGIYGEIGTLFY